MLYLFEFLQDHKTIVTTVSVISLIFFAASLILLPVIISRLPDDYFVSETRLKIGEKASTSVVERLFIILKNILGGVLILAGIVMIVLPGQGLLTILIGFSLTNFPGKYKFERWLISKPSIFRTLNWIRHKAGRNSLQLPT